MSLNFQPEDTLPLKDTQKPLGESLLKQRSGASKKGSQYKR